MSQEARAKPNAGFGPVRMIELEPGVCCVGSYANVSISRWVGRGTAAAVERVAKVGDELRAQYPSGLSSVHLIAEGGGMPTPEAREALVKLMNRKADSVGCIGVVVGGGGFWGSAIRSLITGMRAVSSREYQLKLAGSIEEIVAWLPTQHNKRTGIALDPAELARALTAASKWRVDTE